MTLDPAIAARPFQYKHGDRPLDGYTLQRGAGRGGFGEVYYAISDSGREVALKLVHTYEQVELRGITQCMNLKSPHLVTIFDVRYGSDGRPWVVMEFVAGPSLRELLDAAPAGLGAGKAAYFLREIGKGLTYLHECGIVHRDLKPGNIFYENGYVKIGDYGLSKTMSMTRHSGQTVAVGTLHYMAPEIGEGKYDRSIDIYALGALLYEMLTGQVPFFGSSPAEVLMKHLTADVNLANVPEPFKSVVAKAMAKNPADRYQSVQEMVDAVFGSDAVRDSVAEVSAESLSMAGGRAAQQVNMGVPPPRPPSSSPRYRQPPRDKWEAMADRIGDRIADAGERVKRVGDRFAQRLGGQNFEDIGQRVRAAGDRLADRMNNSEAAPAAARDDSSVDPLPLPARAFLAIVIAGMAAFLAAMNGGGNHNAEIFGLTLLSILGAWVGAALAWALMGGTLKLESKWIARMAIGAPAGLGAILFSLPAWAGARPTMGPEITAIFFSLLLMQWDERLSPTRKARFSVGNLFTSGIFALVLAGIFDCRYPVVFAVVGASLAISLASRWIGKPRRSGWPAGEAIAREVAAAVQGPAAQAAATASQAASTASQAAPEMTARWTSPPPWVMRPRRRWNRGAGGLIVAFGFIFVLLMTRASIRNNGISAFALFAMCAVGFAVFSLVGRKTRDQDGLSPVQAVTGFVLSSIGTAILIAALVLAVAVVADVPSIIAHCDSHTNFNLTRQFDSSNWPQLLSEDMEFASAVLALASLVPTLLARRRAGLLHMVRAVVGAALLFYAISRLGLALPSAAQTNDHLPPQQWFNAYLRMIRLHALVTPMLCVIGGYSILIYNPPSRKTAAAPLPPAPAESAAQPAPPVGANPL